MMTEPRQFAIGGRTYTHTGYTMADIGMLERRGVLSEESGDRPFESTLAVLWVTLRHDREWQQRFPTVEALLDALTVEQGMTVIQGAGAEAMQCFTEAMMPYLTPAKEDADPADQPATFREAG